MSNELRSRANHFRIRTYIIDSEGALEPFDDVPYLEYGTCPNIGDTICTERRGWKFYLVVRRVHIVSRGWAVILRSLEQSLENDRIIKAWNADDEFWEDAERERAEAALAAALQSARALRMTKSSKGKTGKRPPPKRVKPKVSAGDKR